MHFNLRTTLRQSQTRLLHSCISFKLSNHRTVAEADSLRSQTPNASHLCAPPASLHKAGSPSRRRGCYRLQGKGGRQRGVGRGNWGGGREREKERCNCSYPDQSNPAAWRMLAQRVPPNGCLVVVPEALPWGLSTLP